MRKASIALRLAAVVLIPALGASSVRADQITMKATGTLTSVSSNPFMPFPAPWGGASSGDTWSITYVFDSATPNSSFDPSFGQYGPLVSYSLTIGSNSENGPSNSGNILVFGDPFGSVGYTLNGGLASMPGGDFFFSLNDPTVSAWSTADLPTSVDINLFSDRMFRLETAMDFNGNQSSITGTVDSITVVTTPPPPPPPPPAPTFCLKIAEMRRVGNKHVQVRFTIANTNKQTADNLQITGATLAGVHTAASVPTVGQSVAAGGSTTSYSFLFQNMPCRATGDFVINGTSSLGSFTLGKTVTTP